MRRMTTKPEATKTPDDVMNELKVPKQGELDGMESASIKELDTLMEELHAKSASLSRLRTEVGDLKVKLIQTAKKHGVTSYRDETAVPPLVLTLKTRADSVKVAVAEGVAVEADEGDDEGGEEPLQ